MEKPLDLKVEDTKNEIINTINQCQLPAFILEPIIKEIYNQVLVSKNKALEKSKIDYEKSLKEKKGEKDGQN